VIQSFACAETQAIFEGHHSKSFQAIRNVVERKLIMLDAATRLHDLASPPGNRLEALKGNRQGQHSIRINDQFRICFRWTEAGPVGVEVTDYH
jgi:proteic killer suppression protein